MTNIYTEISKLTDKFRNMAYGITQDENKIHEAVQELMLYFLQMNKQNVSDPENREPLFPGKSWYFLFSFSKIHFL